MCPQWKNGWVARIQTKLNTKPEPYQYTNNHLRGKSVHGKNCNNEPFAYKNHPKLNRCAVLSPILIKTTITRNLVIKVHRLFVYTIDCLIYWWKMGIYITINEEYISRREAALLAKASKKKKKRTSLLQLANLGQSVRFSFKLYQV